MSESATSRPRVLIVDDDQAVRRAMARELSRLPVAVLTAESAWEAFDILQAHTVSVLISDLCMPGVDGHEVLVRASHMEVPPVGIVVTGWADRDSAMRAINEAGVWKFISKPWATGQLAELVEEALQKYNKERAAHLPLKIQAHRQETWPLFGDLLGERYRLGGVVGRGGTGAVYEAVDEMLDMPVAIKVLDPEMTQSPKALRDFKNEARIVMGLTHPGIVRVHGLHVSGRLHYMVMERLEGVSTATMLEQHGPFKPAAVVDLLTSCASALETAHAAGVVHKDIKPSNIIGTTSGKWVLIDFGVACLFEAGQESSEIAGTPAYMSPEQARGDSVDQRTDVYALGVVAYRLLSGKVPYDTDTPTLSCVAAGHGPLTGLPDAVLPVLEKATALRPQQRWRTPTDFCTALSRMLTL